MEDELEENKQQSNCRNLVCEPPTDDPVRVYADGIYDLFHFGHARSLEQAKKSFPNSYLLVGCCNDEVTHKYKGKTVMTDKERYESLRHCKWVDEVIPDAPWVITQEFLDKHKIDYVAHDSLPYADASGAGKDVYEFVKAVGKFKETKRTEGISTSDIIMRIVKDYNQYVLRNLDRGYSRKELGVSYVKEKRLRVNRGLKKLREKVQKHQEKVEEKTTRMMKKNKKPTPKNQTLTTHNPNTKERVIEREINKNKDPFAMASTSPAAPPLQLYFDKTWKLSKKEDERQKDFTGPPERQSRRQSELSDHQSCLSSNLISPSVCISFQQFVLEFVYRA